MNTSVNMKPSKNLPYCEFYGKFKDKVKVLVAGPSVYICNVCVAICQEIV